MKKILSLMLIFVMMLAMVACSKDPEKVAEKAEEDLEDAGYEVEVIDFDEPEPDTGCIKYLEAYNEDDGEYVMIFFFEDKDGAEEFYDSYMDELEGEGTYEEEEIMKKDGKIVYIASSEDALKIVK